MLILAVAAGMGAAAVKATQKAIDVTRPATAAPWYAPYVDVTQTPQYPFESLTDNPSNDVVLGFVVASKSGECMPTWGTTTTSRARYPLDLDRRISRLRQRGGDLIVSFGGVANDELARRCTDDGLYDAYSQVIAATASRPSTSTSRVRRSPTGRERAAGACHQAAPGRGPCGEVEPRRLAHAPGGAAGHARRGARRDRGDAARERRPGRREPDDDGLRLQRPAGSDMVDATGDALRASERQLDSMYRRAGKPLSRRNVWRSSG